MIDAWSLAFAYQRLREHFPQFKKTLSSMTMNYVGVDCEIWKTSFLKPQNVELENAASAGDGLECAANYAFKKEEVAIPSFVK